MNVYDVDSSLWVEFSTDQKVNEAFVSNSGQTLTKTLHSMKKELTSPQQTMVSDILLV